MSPSPLGFVVMPFGQKPDPGGRSDIDFDKIYNNAIKKGIIDSGMEPVRADEERTGGIIQEPMFERLLLCDYVRGDEKSLMEKEKRLPIVRFAVVRRVENKPDYRDYATLLELSVLENDFDTAQDHLENALSVVREPWEPKTTANNLRMIERARKDRGIDTSWLLNAIKALDGKGASAD